MRATIIHGAGDVRVETVPDPKNPRTHRCLGAGRRCLHLRERPVALPVHARLRTRSPHRPRVPGHRRGRGRRCGRVRRRRPGRRPVRVVRRHLRLLPGRTADLVPPRGPVGPRRHRRRPGRSGPCPPGRRNPGEAVGRRGLRTHPLLAHPVGRVPDRLPLRPHRRRGPADHRHRHRRRRRRPLRRAVGQTARRRAHHLDGTPPGPHGPGP